jgi:WD40 repeat protein
MLVACLLFVAASPGEAQPPAVNDKLEPAKAALKDLHGDPLPPHVLARMGTARFRHGSHIQSVFYSADGKTLVSVGGDQTTRLWHPTSGKELRSFQGVGTDFGPNGLAVALSPDGKMLATINNNQRVRLIDVATGKEREQFKDLQIYISSVAFSPDGKSLVLATQEEKVVVLDVATGREVRQFMPAGGMNNSFLQSAVYSPDGKLVAASGGDNMGNQLILIWDAASGNELRRISGQRGGGGNVLFSPDGRVLASMNQNQAVQLWDPATGKELKAIGMPNGVASVAFSPDGKTLATASYSGPIHLWDVATGKEVRKCGDDGLGASCVAFAPDGKTVAVGGQAGMLQMFEAATGKEITPQAGHHGAVGSVALSPDGRRAATAGWDRTLRIWETATGKELFQAKAPQANAGGPGPVGDFYGMGGTVCFTPDGSALVVGWQGVRTVRLYSSLTGKEIRQTEELPSEVINVAVAPDGKTFAVATMDGAVGLHDVATGKELRRFAGTAERGPAGPVPFDLGPSASSLAFSPDGKTLASILGGESLIGTYLEARMVIWEVATGKERRRFQFREALNDLALNRLGSLFAGSFGSFHLVFAPDGRTLAVASGSTVRLWDLAHGRELRQFGGQGELIFAAAFTPDGKTLAAGANDGTVRFWDVATGTALGEFSGHRGAALSVAMAEDGKTLVSGGSDTTALVWDVLALVKATRPEKAVPAVKELEALWNDLIGEDAQKADRAIWRLVEAPKQSIPLLKERLRPVAGGDAQKIAQLIAELDSEQFEVRRNAFAELEKLGDQAGPALRKVLAAPPSGEVRRRVEELLEKLTKPAATPEQLGTARAIEVLEQIGTAEAKQLLEALAKGAPEARLTLDAKQALERLAKRTTDR